MHCLRADAQLSCLPGSFDNTQDQAARRAHARALALAAQARFLVESNNTAERCGITALSVVRAGSISGVLDKRDSRSLKTWEWKRRFFVVAKTATGGVLFYFKHEQSTEPAEAVELSGKTGAARVSVEPSDDGGPQALRLELSNERTLLLRGGGGGGKDARWLRVDGPGSGGGAVVRLATRSGVGGGCVRLLRGQRRGRLWRKRLRLRRAREDIRGGVAGGHATGGGDAGRDAGRHARRRAGRRHPARHHEDRAVPQPVRGGLRCGGAVAVLCLLLQQDGLRRGWGRGRLRGRRAARVEAVRVAAEKGAAGWVARVAAPAPAPAGWDVPGSSHGRRQPRRRIRSSKSPESCCSL